MNKLKLILAGLLVVPTVALAVAPAASAEGDFTLTGGVNSAKGDGVNENTADPQALVKQFVNIFLFAVGALSVIMLIWGGIRYTTSAGDSNKVQAAKNTVLYAIVGLVVAILAYAIVNMVMSKFTSGS
jgi:hypothetical protein cdiviTM7_00647